MHRYVPDTKEGKDDIVTYYNGNKSAVDNLDKLIRSYKSQRRCRRWPYGIFFNLLDACCIAGRLLWNSKSRSESHYVFKKELAKELCMPLITKRANLPNLRASVKTSMKLVGVVPSEELVHSAKRQKIGQGRCYLCPRAVDKKSKVFCGMCNRFVCIKHRDETKSITCCNCSL